MRKIVLIGIITSLFLGLGINSNAQTDTEFWFVKPSITAEHTNGSFKFVFTTREFETHVTIEMPAEPAFTPVTLIIPPYTSDEYVVTEPSGEFFLMENNTLLEGQPDIIGKKAIHVQSTAPITAYLTQLHVNNSDIYTFKGSNGIGKEFIIPFQEHGSNQRTNYNERAFSSIEIIGIEDGTVVEITPPAGKTVFRSSLFQNQANPYTVTLNRGEVYTCAPGWDPTVTRNNIPNSGWWGVEGNQHLGGIIVKVLSGPGVAVVKKDDSVRRGTDIIPPDGGWDIIADQWVPYKDSNGNEGNLIGTEYAILKGGLDDGWEYVYVAAPENGTKVWWGNNIDTTITPENTIINEGEQVGIQFNYNVFEANILEIISNKPLSVLHVSGEQKEMGGAVIPPLNKCSGSTSVSFSRDIPWSLYINLIVRAGAEDNFLVDGVVRNDIINPTSFVPLGTSGEWLATQIYYASNDFSDFPVGIVKTFSNTEDVFHLGLINGNYGGGCRYGYYSDFNEIRAGAVTINEDFNPSSTIRACIGESVQLYASGGTDYNWWPTTNLSSPNSSHPTAYVDGHKTYFVEIFGACSYKDTATVTIEAVELPTANFNLDSEEGCSPHIANLTNTTNNATDYLWNFGDGEVANYENVAHAYTNLTNTNVDYTISLIATNGTCSDTAEKIITIHPIIESNITEQNNVTCFGSEDGSAIVTPFGGMQPYTYLWNTGNTDSTLTNVSGGDYFVTVTDFNGCSSISDTLILEPSQFAISLDISNVSCFGMNDGSISVATPASSYLWNNGATTQSINDLIPGDYSLTVTNSNGCISTSGVNIQEPLELEITANSISNTICSSSNDGFIDISVNGGMPPYSYLWSNGYILEDLNNLEEGNYTVTVADVNNCISNQEFNINHSEPYEEQEICMVSVNPELDKNIVYWNKKSDEGISDFVIYKKNSITNIYDIIKTITFNESNIFIDESSFPDLYTDEYKISTVDSCGDESELSGFHKNISLSITDSSEFITLNWEPYTIGSKTNNITEYIIYRGSDSTLLNPLDTIPFTETSYVDHDIESLSNRIYYRIAGVNSSACFLNGESKNLIISNKVSSDFQTGIENTNAQFSSLKIYPNPFENETNIELNLNTNSSILIEIYDIIGNKITNLCDNDIHSGLCKFIFKPNSYGYSGGIYYARISVDNKYITRKIIQVK